MVLTRLSLHAVLCLLHGLPNRHHASARLIGLSLRASARAQDGAWVSLTWWLTRSTGDARKAACWA